MENEPKKHKKNCCVYSNTGRLVLFCVVVVITLSGCDQLPAGTEVIEVDVQDDRVERMYDCGMEDFSVVINVTDTYYCSGSVVSNKEATICYDKKGIYKHGVTPEYLVSYNSTHIVYTHPAISSESKRVCRPTQKFNITISGKSDVYDFSNFGKCKLSLSDMSLTCDNMEDGNADGKCQSGESCAKFKLENSKIERYVKNSREDFVKEDISFVKAELLPQKEEKVLVENEKILAK